MSTRGHLRALPGAVHAPELLTVDDVGARLMCSRRTVFRLISVGDLPSLKVGRQRLVRAEDLDAYVRALVARS